MLKFAFSIFPCNNSLLDNPIFCMRILMSHKKRSAILDKEICNKYLSGLTLSILAHEYNMSCSLISSILKDNKLKGRSKNLFSEGHTGFKCKQEVLDCFDSGCSIKNISKRFNLNESSINAFLKKENRCTSRYSNIREDPLINHVEEIISLFVNGQSANSIARDFKASHASILKILNSHNINTAYIKKYQHDAEYFDCIDTPEKAWIWGLMLTDGNNRRDGGGTLPMTDLDIVEKFKNQLKYTGPIRTYEPRKNRKRMYICSIDSVEMSKKLLALGCPPAKTFDVTYPTDNILPRYLEKYFILGTHDGDGHISNNRLQWNGTIALLQGIERVLIRECGLEKLDWGNRYPEKGPDYNIRSAGVSTFAKIKKILTWLYSDHVISGDRKRIVAERWLEKHSDV